VARLGRGKGSTIRSDYADAVRALHVANLSHFAENPEQLSAYQLGVALRDMCGLLDNPLGHPAADEQSAQFLQISIGAG
jgi:hypothetical protein